MKCILRGYGINMNIQQRQAARVQAADMTRTRGTAQVPQAPRGIICQAGPSGILVTWSLPQGQVNDIQSWRVYKGDEATLAAEIDDRGTRQAFIPTTAGATPPVTNIFVSSVNALGMESVKVQSQGIAATQAGAPTVPPVPPGYNLEGAGGGNKATNFSRFQGPVAL